MAKGKNSILIIICLFFIVVSCSNATDINSYIENTNENILDLQKFTEKKINFVYIFGEYTDNADISAITGCKYKGDIIQDSEYLLLLISNNEIVYQEIFDEKNFEFSRNKKEVVQGIVFRKYNCSKFKIENKPNNFKELLPIDKNW